MPQHHVAPALRTFLFQRDVRNFLRLVEPACRFAFRIAGARHELAEAPALQHHHASTVLAIFVLRSVLRVCGIEVGKVDGILFGEGAAVRIVLAIRATGIERAMLAPLDDQR